MFCTLVARDIAKIASFARRLPLAVAMSPLGAATGGAARRSSGVQQPPMLGHSLTIRLSRQPSSSVG